MEAAKLNDFMYSPRNVLKMFFKMFDVEKNS